MGKDLWVVKVYFMVGVGLDMVTYFRGVTGLMLPETFDEFFSGLAKIRGSTGTIKTVYYVASSEVALGIFDKKIALEKVMKSGAPSREKF